MPGLFTVQGGTQTTRLPADIIADEKERRERQRRTAYAYLSAYACNLHPGAWDGDREALAAARAWRDEIADMLGVQPAEAAPR